MLQSSTLQFTKVCDSQVMSEKYFKKCAFMLSSFLPPGGKSFFFKSLQVENMRPTFLVDL